MFSTGDQNYYYNIHPNTRSFLDETSSGMVYTQSGLLDQDTQQLIRMDTECLELMAKGVESCKNNEPLTRQTARLMRLILILEACLGQQLPSPLLLLQHMVNEE